MCRSRLRVKVQLSLYRSLSPLQIKSKMKTSICPDTRRSRAKLIVGKNESHGERRKLVPHREFHFAESFCAPQLSARARISTPACLLLDQLLTHLPRGGKFCTHGHIPFLGQLKHDGIHLPDVGESLRQIAFFGVDADDLSDKELLHR